MSYYQQRIMIEYLQEHQLYIDLDLDLYQLAAENAKIVQDAEFYVTATFKVA